MQNKALMYGIGAIVVILLGLAAWMLVGKGGPSLSGSIEESQIPQTQNTSLKNLITMGGSHICTFSSSTENSQSQGTVYIADGKMRGDFTSVAAGNTIASHMIVTDNTSYVWSDAMPSGIKMSFDAMATQGNNQSQQSSVDPNAQVDYTCNPWSADASMFVLPSTITFQDISAMMPSATGTAGAGAGVSAQCGACEQAPDAATKAQCKAALNCK